MLTRETDHWLMGGKYIGFVIEDAWMDEDEIQLTIGAGRKLRIRDAGQSCCESRYMTTDDDIKSLVGRPLMRIEVKEGPDLEHEYHNTHETRFLEIGTDEGFVTIVTHNEHNGYYGGFSIQLSEGGESLQLD